MTEQEAVLLTFKVWIWLFKNPGKDKRESPYWNDICSMISNCPLCEFYHKKCCTCFLSINQICGINVDYTVYEKWQNSDYEKRYSVLIVKAIRKYAKKKGWLEK